MKYLFLCLICLSTLFSNGSLFVVNEGDGTVNVIDPTNNAITATITVGIFPEAIAITPDRQRAYVTNEFANSVSVIDLNSNTVIDTIMGFMAGDFPFGIAITPDGRYAYVSNQGNGTVSVIDTSLNSIVKTITVSLAPKDIVVSPDGETVYVTGDFVIAIDTATKMVIASIDIGGTSTGIAISPDGRTVYAVNEVLGEIAVIDTKTNTFISTIPLSPTPTGIGSTISPNGKLLYVSGEDMGEGQIAVFYLPSNTQIATIAVDPVPTEIVFSPDGSLAYVTSLSAGVVNVIDVSERTVVTSIPVGSGPTSGPAGIAFCPSNNLLIVNPKSDVFLTQTELFNTLKWKALPTVLGTTGFRLYRDAAKTDLIASFPITQTTYVDHNLEKNQTVSYFLVQIIAGIEVDIGSATLTASD
jgi:YVTN family beta-propeller protein